jgi:hypothetical protein
MTIASQALTGADRQAFLNKLKLARIADAQVTPFTGANERQLLNDLARAIAIALGNSADSRILQDIGTEIKNRILP